MTVVLVVVAAVLAAACVALGVAYARLRRDRRESLALLGARDGEVSVAIARELHRLVPRDELDGTISSREAILEASPVPILVFDARSVVVRANRAAREAFAGVTPGTAAADIGPRLAEAVRDVIATGQALDHELILGKPDRRTFEAHLRAHPNGSGRNVVAVLVDVTGSVDFREARRLFSAAVSHELRTPLARILGLAETMALPQSDAEREALVAQTEVEIDNMRRLVDEMLLLASLDRGKAALAEGVSNAARIAQDVVDDRRSRRAQRGRDVDVRAATAASVQVAPRLLEVVIGNLVDNALRHAGPDATVTVTVQEVAGNVEIVVADNGVGIQPEHLPHVFERFYRGEASRSGPGSGLGLAIVKHIVEAHDGEVTVESSPRRGTLVRLVLPQASPADGAAGASRKGQASASSAGSGSKR
jgi:signal transduction histidine kinase